MLSEKIHSGEIEIGENIVEREYKKPVSNELDEIMTQAFSVHRRKHPLSKLYVKLFINTVSSRG